MSTEFFYFVPGNAEIIAFEHFKCASKRSVVGSGVGIYRLVFDRPFRVSGVDYRQM